MKFMLVSSAQTFSHLKSKHLHLNWLSIYCIEEKVINISKEIKHRNNFTCLL